VKGVVSFFFQVVDATEMSQEEFRRDFWMLGKPVIMRNATNNWCVRLVSHSKPGDVISLRPTYLTVCLTAGLQLGCGAMNT